MPKSISWDSSFDNSPADTDSVKDGALRIRETRFGVHERLELEHHFGTGAGDEEGRHKFPVGDATARDGLIGVADQMIYFLEEVAGIYLQLRKDGAWTDIRCRNADHADSADTASNADKLDGYDAGNASGQIPISNGTLCVDLNADKLDGYDAGNASGQIPISNGTLCVDLNADKLDGYDAGNSAGQVPVSNGTVCSNLNADLLDGLHAFSFLRSDASDSWTGTLTWVVSAGTPFVFDSNFPYKKITINDGEGNYNITANWSGSHTHETDGGAARITLNVEGTDGAVYLRVSPNQAGGSAVQETYLRVSPNNLIFNGYRVWHAGNGGHGSGLDADLLDGLQASDFARSTFSNANPPRYNWQASGEGVTSGSFAVTSPRTYLVIVNGTLPVYAPGQSYEYWVNIEGVTRNIYVANHPDGSAPWTVNAVVAVTDGSLNFSCHSSLRIKSVTAVCIGGA